MRGGGGEGERIGVTAARSLSRHDPRRACRALALHRRRDRSPAVTIPADRRRVFRSARVRRRSTVARADGGGDAPLLPFLALVRRMLLEFTGWQSTDPLLLVAPAVLG